MFYFIHGVPLMSSYLLMKVSSPVDGRLFAGLKATESDLEKMKCPKCDFQAYYSQQYQEHIASHTEDINKCKCCNFLTFEKDGLLEHFRVSVIRKYISIFLYAESVMFWGNYLFLCFSKWST